MAIDNDFHRFTLDANKVTFIPFAIWNEWYKNGITVNYESTGLYLDVVNIFASNGKHIFRLWNSMFGFWRNKITGDEICVIVDR